MSDPTSSLEIRSNDEPYLVRRPQGYFEYQMPISAKGILLRRDTVLLVGNSRGELELPGGKLEVGETPESCVSRELEEETGLVVRVVRPVHAWIYMITPARHVFVIAYGVTFEGDAAMARVSASPEVGHAAWIPLAELDSCKLPHEYFKAIQEWTSHRASQLPEQGNE